MTAPDVAPRHVVPDVRVVVERDDDRMVAYVHGRVDYTTVGLVRDGLLELAHTAVECLVVDLSVAQLADATGPAALLHVHDACRARSVEFVLEVAAGSSAEATLRGCGLLNLLRRT